MLVREDAPGADAAAGVAGDEADGTGVAGADQRPDRVGVGRDAHDASVARGHEIGIEALEYDPYLATHVEKPIGPELYLTLGKIGYGKGGEITWPDPSQITLKPEHLDPIDILTDLVSSHTASKSESTTA